MKYHFNIKEMKLGKINAINNDCLDVMKTYPNNYFDLAIVDPQYGIGSDKPSEKPHKVKQKNGTVLNVEKSKYPDVIWDDEIPSADYFIELKRVSKEQIIFGANYFTLVYPEILSKGWLIWDKLNGESDQMGCEIASVSLNRRTDIVYYMWHGMMQGKSCSKKIREAIQQQGDKSKNQKRIHPTEKPILLYKWILQEYAKTGYKILDTHGGSMSHAIACHDLNFELTIIEKSDIIFKEATDRLRNHQLQQKIDF